MAKNYKVLVNTGKAANNKVFDVQQYAGDKGQAVRIKAQAGVKYVLEELERPRAPGPDRVLARRNGKNLEITFEGGSQPDLIIEDYYSEMPTGYNGLVGQAENGSFYEYIPEDPAREGFVPDLVDGFSPTHLALGGEEVSAAGAAVGVFAISPLWGAVGAAGAAAAGGGGGGTKVTATALSVDAVTADNTVNATEVAGNMAITGKVSGGYAAGDTVILSVNGKTFSGRVQADGSYSISVPATDLATDADHQFEASITGTGGTKVTTSHSYAVDIAPTQAVTITAVIDNEGDVTGNVANGGTTDDANLNLSGTLSDPLVAGEVVQVFDGSIYLGNATITGTSWTFADGRTLANGAHPSYTAKVVGLLGDAGTASSAYTVTINTLTPTITIGSIAADAVNDSTALSGTLDGAERATVVGSAAHVVVSGTSTNLDGRDLTVTINNHNYTATVATGGAWSVQVTDADALALNHGNTYGVFASGTTTGGKTATDTNNSLLVNIATPDIPTVVNNHSGTTTPTLTGLAMKEVPGTPVSYIKLQSGDNLTVTVGGATYTGTLDTAVTNNGLPTGLSYDIATGQWSLNTTTAIPTSGTLSLASGNTYDVGVTVTAGSVTKTDISSGELRIDTTLPTITLAAISGDGYLNASEASQSLTITGTTTAQVGSTVTLTGLDGTTRTATVVAGSGANNAFSLYIPSTEVHNFAGTNASKTVIASVVNQYGLSGQDSKPLVIDLTGPAAVDDNISATEDNVGSLTGSVGNNDTGKDGSETYTLNTLSGTYGRLVLDSSTGAYSYTVANNAALQALTASTSETFSYTIKDAAGNQSTATLSVRISPVNDAPVNTVPGAQSTTEDTAKDISGLSISDVDAGAGTVSVTLSATHGTINVTASTGVTISSNGTASVSLSGGVAAINALLANTSAVIYTPNANYNGSDTLTMTTNDGGNTGSGGALTDSDTVAITVTAVNDAPLVNAQGTNTAYTENATPLAANSAITLLDVDSANLTGATVTISGGLTAGDVLAFTNANGITGSYSNGVLTLSGTATVAQYQAALQSVTYASTSDNPTATSATRTLSWQVDDGLGVDHASNIGTSTISLTAFDDAPVNTVSGAQTTSEAREQAITGLSVADVDSPQLTLTLSVAHGTLNLASASGVWISGNNSASVTLVGAVADLNALLASANAVRYTGNSGYSGSDILTLLSSDGQLTDSDTVALTVLPVNVGTTAISPDTGTSASDFLTSVHQLRIAGNVSDLSASGLGSGDKVQVVVRDSQNNIVKTALVAPQNGQWQLDNTAQTLADGTYTVQVSLLDAAGHVMKVGANTSFTIESAAVTTTVDITAITDDTGVAGDFVTSDSNGLTVSATLSTALVNGQVLQYSRDGINWTDISSSANGTDVRYVDSNLTSTATVQMRVVSATGLVGSTASQLVTIDTAESTQTVAITHVIDDVGAVTGTVVNGGTTDDASLDLSGTLSAALGAGEVLKVYDGSTYLGNATVTGTSWTFADARVLANGAQSRYTAKVVDLAGNAGSTSSDWVVNINTSVPTITIGSIAADAVDDSTALSGTLDGAERATVVGSAAHVVVSGTSTNLDGRDLTVTVNNHNYTATVATGGAWSVQVTDADALALNHGNTYGVFASGTTTGGKTATDTNNSLLVNIATPDIPTVVNKYSGTTTPTLTGMAMKEVPGTPVTYIALQNGDQISIVVGGATYTATIGSLPAGISYNANTGTWSLDTDSAVATSGVLTLASGNTYDVGVTVTAGSVTKTDISSGELRIDTTQPTIALAAISGDGYLNANEVSQSLTITGTTTAQVGSTVTLTGLDGSTRTATVVAGSGGNNTFSVDLTASEVSAFASTDATKTVSASVVNQYGLSASDSQSLVIDITRPVAVADTANATEDDVGSIAGSVASNDSLQGGESFVLTTSVGTYGNLSLTSEGVYSYTVTNSAGLQALTADTTETFSYQVTDAAGNQGTATLTIHISAVNDAPVNTVPGAQSTNEDTALVIGSLAIADVDAGSRTMTVTLSATYGTITLDTGIGGVNITGNASASVTLSGTVSAINALLTSTHGVTYAPDANYNGSDTLTMSTHDGGNSGSGGALTDVDTVAITVNAVNDAPVQTTAGAITTVSEDSHNNTAVGLWSTTPAYGVGGGSDEAGQTLSYKITAIPGFISLYKADGTAVSANDTLTADEFAALKYKTVADANGSGSISFDVIDSGAGTSPDVNTLASQSVVITVHAVNDAPVVNAQGTNTAYTENATPLAANSAITLSDVDSANLTGATVTISGGLTAGDVLAFSNANGITGSYNSTTGVLTLSGTATVAQYQTALQSVTYVSTSGNPTATSATRTLSWQVDDGQGANHASNTATSTVTITAVDDEPTGADTALTLIEEGSITLAVADFGFADVDGHSLTGVKITTLPTGGTLALNGTAVTANQVITTADIAAGHLVYTPVIGGHGANYASLQFKVQDSGLTHNEALSDRTITLNVTPLTRIALDPVTADNTINAAESVGTITVSGQVSGAYVTGDQVTLHFNNSTLSAGVQADGSFSFSVAASSLMADANLTIEASVSGTGGTPAQAQKTYTVDTAPPANVTVSLDAITGDDYLVVGETDTGVTHTLTGIVTGDFLAGDVVTLSINGQSYSGAVDSAGRFAVANVLGSDLKNDPDHTVAASFTARDAAGNTSTVSTTRGYSVNSGDQDGQATTIRLQPVTGDNIIDSLDTTAAQTAITGRVTGVFAAGDVVTLSLNNTTATGAVAADGTFSINVNTADLSADADLQIEARVTGTGGDTATASQHYALGGIGVTALSLDAVTLDNIVNLAEALIDVPITGKVSGAFLTTDTITLLVNGTSYTGHPDANGSFSISVLGTDLALDADSRITASVTGTGGSAATAAQDYGLFLDGPTTAVTIDAISLDSGISDSDFITNDNDGLTLHATLSSPLSAGEHLWYSKDNGVTWVDISTSVIDAAVSHFDANLTSSATVKMEVRDASGNLGGNDTQAIVIDTSGENTQPDNQPDFNAYAAVVSIDAITEDTGTSVADFVTQDNNGLTYSGSVTQFTDNGAGVHLVLTNGAGATVASAYVLPTMDNTSASTGNWSWTPAVVGGIQADGHYTLSATVVDVAGNAITGATHDSQLIVIDSSGAHKDDGSDDINKSASIAIGSIDDASASSTAANGSKDSGVSNSDFVTNDNTLTFKGSVTGFSNADGGKVHLVVSQGTSVVVDEYLDPDNAGAWSFNRQASALADGSYTIDATIVDRAGNTVVAATPQTLVIDTSTTQKDDGSADDNSAAEVAITSIHNASSSIDSGVSSSDFVTTDPTLIISGTTTNFMANGDLVHVRLYDQAGTTLLAQSWLTPSANTWSWYRTASALADGTYQIRADIVDLAGNTVKAGSPQTLVIDNAVPATTVAITAISQDTGDNTTDFITSDHDGLTVSATLSAALVNGQVLEYSNDNGLSWTNITSSVSGMSVSHVDAALTSTNTVQMRVVSQSGVAGAADSQLVTIDAQAPAQTVVITDVLDNEGAVTGTVANGGVTDDTSLNLQGTLSAVLGAGEVLKVYDGSTYLGQASVNGTGWTFVDTRILSNNQAISYSAKVEDIAGNTSSASSSYSVSINNSVPTITIGSISGDAVNDSTALSGTYDATERGSAATTVTTRPVVSGTATALDGQTLSVTVNGKAYSALVSNGAWSVELSTSGSDADAVALNHGSTYSVSVSGTTTGGKTATDTNNSLVINTALPDVPTVLTHYSGTLTPTLSGHAEKLDPSNANAYIKLETGDMLSITVGGATYSGTLDTTAANNGLPTGLSYDVASGNWSLNTATASPSSGTLVLASGNTYNVAVTATSGISVANPSGVSKSDISAGELVINTTAPTITLDAVSGDGYLNVTEAGQSLTLTGSTTAQVGSVVTITGLDGSTRTTTVVTGNTFALTLSPTEVAAFAGSNASKTVTASVVNLFSLSASNNKPLVIDITAPVAVADSVTANEDISSLTGSVGSNDTALDGSETYSLQGTAIGQYGSISLGSNGSWTYTVSNSAALNALAVNATEQFNYTITDAAGNHSSATLTVTLTPVNDAPVNTVPGSQSTDEDTAKAISGLSVADVDAGSAAITVTLSVLHGTLNAAATTGVTIGNNGSASVTLSGSVADINTLLANVNGLTYTPSVNYNGSDTLTMLTDDGGNTGSGGALTDSDTVAITVTSVNDAPVVNAQGTSTAYTENGSALVVNSAITLSDVDSATLSGATVTIGTGYTAGDTLAFTAANGISGSYSNGVLTLSGTATVAQYQAALRSVTYASTSDNPTAISATRTLSWQVNDGESVNNLSGSVDSTITITAVNDAPVVDAHSTVTAYTENGVALTANSAITLSDADNANLTRATVTISSGYTAGDELAFATANGISGSWDSASGVLTLSGSATVAQYQAALRSVTFLSTSEDPTAATRTLSWLVDDGQPDNHASSAATSTITVAPVNDAPVVNVYGPATSYTENGSAIIANGMLALSDVDSANLTGATVTISSGLTAGDVLAFSNANGISSSYNSATGVLTLSGTATVAQYQAALQSVTYVSTSDNPTATSATRTLSWQVNDGQSANQASNVGTSTITVTPVDDAPVGTSATLTVLEDTNLIFSAASFGFSDVDGHTLTGIKITSLPAAGTLTLNGEAVTADQVVTVADINAGLLVFAPAANANGTGYASFGFKVQDSGSSNIEALSANTITIDVTSVNDTPVTANVITTTVEDTPIVARVSTLLAGYVTDPDAGDSVKGITIQYFTNTMPVGTLLEWSADGSTNWTSFPAELLVPHSNYPGKALFLLSSAYVRYTPVANYNNSGGFGAFFRVADSTMPDTVFDTVLNQNVPLANGVRLNVWTYASTMDTSHPLSQSVGFWTFKTLSAPDITSAVISHDTGSGRQYNYFNAGDTVTATVTFDEAVTVTGTPTLKLNIGGTLVNATYASGSGTGALKFTYTILAGQTDTNGISIDANSLALNGGTIKNSLGNSAAITHVAVADDATHMVDTTAPVLAVTQLTGTETSIAATGGTGTVNKYASVAALPDGSYVTVWQSNVTGDYDVYMRVVKADGTVLNSQIKVNDTTTGNQVAPQVVALTGANAGKFVVVWGDAGTGLGDSGGSTATPYGKVYGLSNGVLTGGGSIAMSGTNFDLFTNFGAGTNYSLNATPSGGLVITNQNKTYGDAYLHSFDSTLSLGTANGVKLQEPAGFYGYYMGNTPDMTVLANGNYAFVYMNDGPLGPTSTGARFDSYLAIYNPGTSTWVTSAPVKINATAQNESLGLAGFPKVTTLQNGEVGVVWQSTTADGGDVRFQRFSNTGVKVGSEVRVNTSTSGIQSSPDITALNDGGYVVVWRSQNIDGSGFAVMSQRYDSTGAAVGTEQQINTAHTSADQVLPSVVQLANGALVYTYQDQNTTSGSADNATVSNIYQEVQTSGLATNTINTAQSNKGVDVYGTSDQADGQTLTVTWGSTVKTVTVTGGKWSASFVGAEVPSATGPSTINVSATDAAGNTGTTTKSVTIFGGVDLSTITNGTGGFVINGQCAGDNSGWSVSSAGDVNGDGLDDLIVGALLSDPAAGADAGRSYVVFGKTGTVAVDLSTVAGGTGGFVINGQSAGNQSGKSVSGIGDINGDGLADLLVGAPLNGTSSPGAGYVVYGKANTTAVNLSAVAAGTGGFALFGQSAGDNAGGAVSAAGDVNGDGYADFLVNSPYNDANAFADAGRSYVVFGKAGMTSVNLSSLTAGTSTSGFVINGQAASDLAGYTLSNAGDVNGDGLADILIGAYSNDVGTIVDAGRTYIVFGKTSATAINLSDLTAGTSTAGFVINGQCSNDRVGFSVSNAGDVNGDGLADIVIGASGVDTAAGTDAGRSYVVFGKTSGTAVDVTALAAGNGGYIINGQAASEYSGSAVSYAGDINGDGLADLLIATGWSDPEAGTDAGRTYVVYGQSGTSAINLSAVAAGTGGFVINGQGVSDFSGYSVSNAGDVNGDGYADLIVGARYSDPTAGTDAGRSYVIYGGSRFVSGAMATGTGTSASELVIGTSGADTLTGNGGTDRFSAGAGNDTIVLTSSDLTNLASTTASALVSTVDGGEGYDTLRLTGGASLNLSGISNASAVNNDGSSRINSIERIDMATDTAANTLTLTVEDVNDMSPLMNQIRLGGSTSNNPDGRVWTNVSGTALSATTSFHQLVVDGTASDTLVLKPDAGFWGLKGVVSNGSDQYNVYQNSLTQSQVIVAQGVVVDNQDPVTNVTVNQTFESGLSSTLKNYGSSSSSTYNGGQNANTSDTDNEFRVYAGNNTGAYWHIDSTAVSAGSRVTDFTASFKYFLSSTSGDGLNFSLGDKSTLSSTFENGYSSGLSVKLNHLTAGSGSYYLYWNNSLVASSAVVSYNTVHTFDISVTSAGAVTVKSDGATLISSTISGWSTANMAGWEFGIGGRTGGNSGSAWVDDLLINATRAVAPVVLDLNRDGTFSYTHTLMDVTGDSLVDFTAWAAAPDGVLVWNKYGDGLVHDASQYAFSQYGGVSDLAGLAAGFDSNHDGVLDANDAKFAEFMVWQDTNGNGMSDAGEVKSLADWDMASINLRSDGTRATPADGVTEVGHTSATLADGTSMRVADAAFDYHTATAEEQASHALAQGDTVFKLSMGQVLDLSAVTGAHALTEVDASADAAANTIRLTLADLLATPSTQAHTLKLTGDSNDTVVLDLSEWTHSDTTVTENGHTYAVYNPHAMMADQLLIDQHMLVTQNG